MSLSCLKPFHGSPLPLVQIPCGVSRLSKAIQSSLSKCISPHIPWCEASSQASALVPTLHPHPQASVPAPSPATLPPLLHVLCKRGCNYKLHWLLASPRWFSPNHRNLLTNAILFSHPSLSACLRMSLGGTPRPWGFSRQPRREASSKKESRE